jgi:hypothetical protein
MSERFTVPEVGYHVGHQIEKGYCTTCGRYLTKHDLMIVSCSSCGALGGQPCRDDRGRPRKAMHRERVWLAHGHKPSEFAGLKARSGSKREGQDGEP